MIDQEGTSLIIADRADSDTSRQFYRRSRFFGMPLFPTFVVMISLFCQIGM
jgi:hypothetical protein